ncbi:MAG: rRNA adenine N-6-methyltransferase family protein [Candidatus Diapherotrites archaeon]
MDLFSELNSLMVEYRFRPSSKMAQFFTVDEELIDELISLASLNKKDRVLDIGAGTGFITRKLSEKCGKVTASEIDPTLCRILREKMPGNVEIVEGSFIGKDWNGFSKIVSYPPQNICGEIVAELLMNQFTKAVLLLGEDFSERLISEPGFSDYSAITILLQYLCKADVKRSNISSKFFFPKPNSFHSIVVLERKKEKIKMDNQMFYLFLKSLFRYRNKNLCNALENVQKESGKKLKIGKKEIENELKNEKLANKKLNLLSVKEFAELFNRIYRG